MLSDGVECPIAPFTPDGFLPPGDYAATFAELRGSVLVLGPGEPAAWPDWDCRWRERLVGNLEVLVSQLWQVGVTEVYVDGSFTEDKNHPNDIDGYFEMTSIGCGPARLCGS